MSHHTVSFEHKEAGSFIWNISNTNKQLFAILGHMSHHTVSLNTKRHGASFNVSNTSEQLVTIIEYIMVILVSGVRIRIEA